MKATHFMALALALTLVGVPTLALSADLSTSPESFKALSHVSSTAETSPTPLTDQELAHVEGGQSSEVALTIARGLYLLAVERLFGGDVEGAVPLVLSSLFFGAAGE